MTIDNALIGRFLSNQCTEEEALAVSRYLTENPEKLDTLLPQTLWNNIDDKLILLPAAKKAELLKAIRAKLKVSRRRPSWVWSLSAATSLLVIVGLSWLIGKGTNEIAQPKHTVTKTTTAYTLVQINYGKEDLQLHVADGSVIYLKPGGEIRYPEHFGKQKRDFSLKGIARFKVAKDKNRPFNVYAGGTVTTALGTDFTISSVEGSDDVSVFLHTGKVVVSADTNGHRNAMKRTYLLPGNKLRINKVNFNLALIKNADQPAVKRNTVAQAKGQTEITATEISFKNQSLDKIFEVLRTEFAANIEFAKAQFNGMYFTGSFKRNSQTADNILGEVALLNRLEIEIRGTVYIIKRQTKKQ